MTAKALTLMIIPLWLMVASSALCADFIDSTNEAGVPGTGVGNGVAFVDYDGDGNLDLYVSADPHDILYRNNGDGTFEDVTVAAGISVRGDGVAVAFGDYDNDGDPDLYVAVNDGWDVFFENDGGGKFRDVSWDANVNNPRRARSAAFADFDNDGFLDVYVVNEDAANILYRNRNGRIFQDVAEAMGVADRGQGRSCVWTDYDNDGDLDLYVTNKGDSNILYRNDGLGFKDITEDAGVEGIGDSTGVAAADYDNDGNMDIYVNGEGSHLYRGNGDGTFTDMAVVAGITHSGKESTPAFGDYDNDGDLDLYLAVWEGESVMYSNNGDGTFQDVTAQVGMGASGSSWSAVFGDYDGDGDLDIYTTYTTRSNILYQNSGNDNNWLHIKSLGTLSNGWGIGARVELSVNGRVQIREVSGGSGYGSQPSFTVEFGLGADTVVDLVKIKWPSGVVTRFTDVPANQLMVVEENFLSVETVDTRYQGAEIIRRPALESCLMPNYPNPFNPETWFPYRLAESANVKITIYNLSGRLIRTLDLGLKGAGSYTSKVKAAYWDGRSDIGEHAASGIYFYQLKAGNFLQMRKMILEQ